MGPYFQKILTARRIAFLGLLAAAVPACAAVPPVVLSNHQTVYSSLTNGTGRVSANKRGDVFFSDIANKTLIELPADGSGPVILLTNLNGPKAAIVDTADNVYVSNSYSGRLIRVPFVNGSYPAGVDATTVTPTTMPCSPGLTVDCAIPGLGAASVGYFAQYSDATFDAAGNIYLVDVNDNTSQGAYNRIVKVNATGSTTTVLVDALPSSGNAQIASDSVGNLYYANGQQLFKVAAGSSSAVAVNTATLLKPYGVTIDVRGNLIVSDSGNTRIVCIPYENGALNFSDQYTIGPYYSQNSVGVDSFGTVYYTGPAGGASTISALHASNFNFPATNVNTNSSYYLLYAAFNATMTFSKYASSSLGGLTVTPSASTCTLGTTYNAGQSCSFNVVVKPTRVGPVSGLAGVGDANGNFLAQMSLTSIGLGSAINVDPGTVTGIGSGFTAPAGVAVDKVGNVFIADSSAGAVYELAGGSGSPIPIGSGWSTPTGVAVDAAGNLFVADSGSRSVIEIPVMGTALNPSAQVVVADQLSLPIAIATGPLGSLYIAQAGVLGRYAQRGMLSYVLTDTLSTAYLKPRALAVDPSGNVFVADEATGQVVKIASVAGTTTTVASGLTTPTGLATDAAGNLFLADSGTAQLVRIPNVSGTLDYAAAVPASTVTAPFAVAADASGNLIVSDSAAPSVYRVQRTSASVQFGYVSQGVTSPALAATVLSSGNQSLALGTPLYSASGDTSQFASAASSCAAAQTLAPGSFCDIAQTFTPTAKVAYSETLTLNASPTVATATTAVFSGTGTFLAPTSLGVALTAPTGVLSYGDSATFTATLTPSQFNVADPSGSVTFSVNGIEQRPIALTNHTASITVPNLSGGNNTVSAVYAGDANYSGSTASPVTVDVTPAKTTTTLAVTTTYTNPASSAVGAALTLTSTVNPTVAGSITGSVNFVSGAVLLGSAALVPNQGSNSYTAVLSTSSIPAGTYSVQAVFPGNANYEGSSSAPFPLIVSAAGIQLVPDTTSVTATPTHPGIVNLNVASLAGLGMTTAAPVVFSCEGLPQYATCRFTPAYINLSASTPSAPVAPTAVTLTIAVNVPPDPTSQTLAMVRTGASVFALLLIVPFAARRRMGLRLPVLLVLVLLGSIGALSASGCGNSSSSKYITPTGTSTVTVKAYSSTTSTNTTSATVPITLTVAGN